MEKIRTFLNRERTAAWLKAMAAVTMLIDHAGAVILEYGYALRGGLSGTPELIDQVLRGIGRIAFPLYIILMTEGFFRTRSRRHYLGRLAVFALISEVPFNLALGASVRHLSVFNPGYQNVFFTLTIGLAVMWGCETVLAAAGAPARMRPPIGEERQVTGAKLAGFAGCVVIVIVGMVTAEALQTDYGSWGVTAMAAAWMIRRYSVRAVWEYAGIIPVLAFMNPIELIAAAGILPVSFYRGARGNQGNRWFWYILYPAHLLLFTGIRVMIFGGI